MGFCYPDLGVPFLKDVGCIEEPAVILEDLIGQFLYPSGDPNKYLYLFFKLH